MDQCQSIPLEQQLDAVLCSMALISVEVNNDETQVELLRLAFALQQFALEGQLRVEKTAGLHNLVARYVNLCSQFLSIPVLCQHVQQVLLFYFRFFLLFYAKILLYNLRFFRS